MLKYVLTCIVSMLYCSTFLAQDSVVVNDIIIKGNKHTKKAYILKSLAVEKGDTLSFSDISSTLDFNRTLLLGTALFQEVSSNIRNWESNAIDLVFEVKEGWYILPSFIFEFADRNFNVWLREHGLDFSRINYGIGLSHVNLTGHGDAINAKIQRGFNNKYELSYERPLLFGDWSFTAEYFHANYNEIPIATSNNKTLFLNLESKEKILRRNRITIGTEYWRDAINKHKFELLYYNHYLDKQVLQTNSDYFNSGRNTQRWFALRYTYTQDRRVFNFYPAAGHLLEIQVDKDGLGLVNEYSNLSLLVTLEHYLPIVPKLVNSNHIIARARLNNTNLSYYNRQAVGYEDFTLRGYELYVIDGSDFLLYRTALRYKLKEATFNWGKLMILDSFRKMPYSIHPRLSIEAGYVYNQKSTKDNPLDNSLLIGGGLGIDVVLFYKLGLSFEYSINRQGDKGVFMRLDTNF